MADDSKVGSDEMSKDNQSFEFEKRFKKVVYANRIFLAGSSAAVCGVVAGYPFDSLKTRMQTYNYKSIFKCAKVTIAEEGFFGLYRGILPPLLTISLTKSTSFSIYEYSKNKVNKLMYPESKTEAGMVNDSKQKSLKSIFFNSVISGGISGSFVAVFAAPLELIKIQMQLASLIHKEQLSKIEKLKAEVAKKGLLDPKVYQARLAALNNLQAVNSRVEKMYFSKNGKMSNFASIKKIVQTRGVFGLYTGLGIHVVRDFFGTGIYFSTYELFKETLKRTRLGSNNADPLIHMIAGGFCGVVAWLIIFPIDLVKSIVQKDSLAYPHKYMSPIKCFKYNLDRYGFRGVYRGISVTLIRAFPLHALNLTVYEYVREILTDYAKPL